MFVLGPYVARQYRCWFKDADDGHLRFSSKENRDEDSIAMVLSGAFATLTIGDKSVCSTHAFPREINNGYASDEEDKSFVTACSELSPEIRFRRVGEPEQIKSMVAEDEILRKQSQSPNARKSGIDGGVYQWPRRQDDTGTPLGLRPRQSVEDLRRAVRLRRVDGPIDTTGMLQMRAAKRDKRDEREDGNGAMFQGDLRLLTPPNIDLGNIGSSYHVARSPNITVGETLTAVGALVAATEASKEREKQKQLKIQESSASTFRVAKWSSPIDVPRSLMKIKKNGYCTEEDEEGQESLASSNGNGIYDVSKSSSQHGGSAFRNRVGILPPPIYNMQPRVGSEDDHATGASNLFDFHYMTDDSSISSKSSCYTNQGHIFTIKPPQIENEHGENIIGNIANESYNAPDSLSEPSRKHLVIQEMPDKSKHSGGGSGSDVLRHQSMIMTSPSTSANSGSAFVTRYYRRKTVQNEGEGGISIALESSFSEIVSSSEGGTDGREGQQKKQKQVCDLNSSLPCRNVDLQRYVPPFFLPSLPMSVSAAAQYQPPQQLRKAMSIGDIMVGTQSADNSFSSRMGLFDPAGRGEGPTGNDGGAGYDFGLIEGCSLESNTSTGGNPGGTIIVVGRTSSFSSSVHGGLNNVSTITHDCSSLSSQSANHYRCRKQVPGVEHSVLDIGKETELSEEDFDDVLLSRKRQNQLKEQQFRSFWDRPGSSNANLDKECGDNGESNAEKYDFDEDLLGRKRQNQLRAKERRLRKPNGAIIEQDTESCSDSSSSSSSKNNILDDNDVDKDLLRRKRQKERRQKERQILGLVQRLQDNPALIAEVEAVGADRCGNVHAVKSTYGDSPTLEKGALFVKTPLDQDGIITGYANGTRERLLAKLENILSETKRVASEASNVCGRTIPEIEDSYEDLILALCFTRFAILSGITVREFEQKPDMEKITILEQKDRRAGLYVDTENHSHEIEFLDPKEEKCMHARNARLSRWIALPSLRNSLGLDSNRSASMAFSSPPTPYTSNVSFTSTITSRTSLNRENPKCNSDSLRRTVEIASNLLQKMTLANAELLREHDCCADDAIAAKNQLKRCYFQLMKIRRRDIRAVNALFVPRGPALTLQKEENEGSSQKKDGGFSENTEGREEKEEVDHGVRACGVGTSATSWAEIRIPSRQDTTDFTDENDPRMLSSETNSGKEWNAATSTNVQVSDSKETIKEHVSTLQRNSFTGVQGAKTCFLETRPERKQRMHMQKGTDNVDEKVHLRASSGKKLIKYNSERGKLDTKAMNSNSTDGNAVDTHGNLPVIGFGVEKFRASNMGSFNEASVEDFRVDGQKGSSKSRKQRTEEEQIESEVVSISSQENEVPDRIKQKQWGIKNVHGNLGKKQKKRPRKGNGVLTEL